MAIATEDFIKQVDEMTVLELNELVKALEEHYHALDREMWVLDLTTDFGVPIFAAVSLPEGHGSSDELLLGFRTQYVVGLAIECLKSSRLLRRHTERCRFTLWSKE